MVSEPANRSTGRTLQLRARAERQLQVHGRITEAAVQLHQEVGPLRTTISAIAELAGVERLTVYRHFPDEKSLLAACQSHFFALHPPPNPADWVSIADFDARVRTALASTFGYWNEIQEMAATVLRDHEIDPERAGGGFVQYMTRCREALLAGQPRRGSRAAMLSATVGHALNFTTWRSLVREGGMSQRQAVDLMAQLIRSVRPAI